MQNGTRKSNFFPNYSTYLIYFKLKSYSRMLNSLLKAKCGLVAAALFI